jgi:hypothetical protein
VLPADGRVSCYPNARKTLKYKGFQSTCQAEGGRFRNLAKGGERTDSRELSALYSLYVCKLRIRVPPLQVGNARTGKPYPECRVHAHTLPSRWSRVPVRPSLWVPGVPLLSLPSVP